MAKLTIKVLVSCLLVIVSVNNDGRASLESFAPISSNIFWEETTQRIDTSCYRPCKFNVKPRRCHHTFRVEPTIMDDGKPGITINGMSPGPMIHACVNDIIVVEVENRIPDQELAIHWHGVEQRGSPYMDGVPMVTQCPITYGAKYKYAFIASSPGTFFYHADSVYHHSDGVYGSLIINQPAQLEQQASLYDFDKSQDNTLLISARFPELMTGNLEDMTQMLPEELLINGDEENVKLFVTPGFTYRLRLINAIAIECPVSVTIDRHEMVAIATDGRPVKPVAAKTANLMPGERMDVVVRASQDGGGYWVRVRGSGACAGVSASALLLYSGFNYTSMLDTKDVKNGRDNIDSAAITGQMLESFKDVPYISEPKSVYLGIDKNIVKESDNDYRYISDAIPKKPFYPAYVSLREDGVVQINGKNLLYPNAPILLQPRDVKTDKTCAIGLEKTQKDPQCLQILDVEEGETLEIALVNEGFGSNESYTFHFHGSGVQVVATGKNPSGEPLSRPQFIQLDRQKKINRNLQSPPIKDTITVPNKGYTIVRMRPDRGSWLLECRACGLSSLPAAIIINFPQNLPKAVSQALPKCGSYRPPDVLLN